ncbi:MAG TPA: DNA alkylation repair protein [Candidatus Nanoarchaeia archaeon]|nr:DNA alkylation repair protein [Candidatus Nanoarchaeia archaeon]
MSLTSLKTALKKAATPQRAKVSQRFFKTGKGQYGEGDVFIGITVPEMRKIAHTFKSLSLPEIKQLLESPIHEERFIALEILVYQFDHQKERQKEIYQFYLKNTNRINNWDLVDTSAEYIVGAYLKDKDTSILTKLANSSSIWERRIAIVSTFNFIKNNQFQETLKIATLLLKDNHDLIHKAVGWMLREIGKRDQNTLKTFLKQHHNTMPRTMLRYAIERFPKDEREQYMK